MIDCAKVEIYVQSRPLVTSATRRRYEMEVGGGVRDLYAHG